MYVQIQENRQICLDKTIPGMHQNHITAAVEKMCCLSILKKIVSYFLQHIHISIFRGGGGGNNITLMKKADPVAIENVGLNTKLDITQFYFID